MKKYLIPSLLGALSFLAISCVHSPLGMDPEKERPSNKPSSSVAAPATPSLQSAQDLMELDTEPGEHEEELRGAAAQRSAAPAAARSGEKRKRHTASEESEPQAKRPKLAQQQGTDSSAQIDSGIAFLPAVPATSSPQPGQEQPELDSKEQAALDEALLKAAQRGDAAAVASALEQGANIEAKDEYRQAALHCAAEQGRLEVAQVLLARGADIEAKDIWGNNALHWAAIKNHLEVAQLLLDQGANTHAQDNGGQTALQRAAYWGRPDMVHILLDRGANIHAQDNDGKTALDLAKVRGHQEVVDTLLEVCEQRKQQELEALEELQLAPTDLNELIANMGYGDKVE
jgi:hypothetical protein